MKHLTLSLALLVASSSALAQQAAPPVPPPAVPPTPPGPAVIPTQNGQDAAAVMGGVQTFYDRTQDFQAAFQQDSRNANTGVVTRQAGTLRVQKPGRMRWDYTTPAGNIIVSDGTTLWTYEPAQHQAFQVPLNQSQIPSVLSFLLGTGSLAQSFQPRLLAPGPLNYPNGFVLELRPLQPHPSVDRVLFFVEPAQHQLVRLVVFDAQGNSNSFTFTNPQVNMHPAAALFHWAPPAGTQIVRP